MQEGKGMNELTIIKTVFPVSDILPLACQIAEDSGGWHHIRTALSLSSDWSDWSIYCGYAHLFHIAGITPPTDQELIEALSNRETAYMWVRKWGGRPIDLYINRTASFKDAYAHYKRSRNGVVKR
jgi:hypothetical protein